MNHRTIALLFVLCLVAGPASADSPTGWSPVIIATGDYREQIKSMPIEKRPNRPFHFYGNTVRRLYYRQRSTQPLARPSGQVNLSPLRLVR
ncbi:MAG: hypothetical protein AAGA03_20295 [Planctomycetota bacterium]